MSLDELRKRIDELDGRIVGLLNERSRVALDIGRLKAGTDGEVYVPARDREVLDRVAALGAGPLAPDALRAIYREIVSAAVALERTVQVAYFGPPATFTHQAARARFGASIGYLPCETIRDVFTRVEKRTADYGVVPIENSTEGAVTHTLDQFAETPLKICAEIYLPITHHLLAKGPREAIRRVYSHPNVFGQCRNWMQDRLRGVDAVPVSSTARAAERAAGEEGSAALAGQLAAEIYGLDVIERDVQDLGGNQTRFLVIGKTCGQPTGNDRTSLLFALAHQAGALFDALQAFSRAGINMTKIESRPSRTKAWEYYFFVDVEGHAGDPPVAKALEELAAHCRMLTVLGSYPRMAGREG